MRLRWMTPWTVGLAACLQERPSFDCEQVAIRDTAGAVDDCDRQACQACVDACGSDCVILESFPPQYTCDAGHWDVDDACPDWRRASTAVPCEDAPTTVAPDEVTPLGFSADQVLAAVAGPFEAEAQWVAEEGRAATTVSLSVAAGSGSPVLHDLTRGGATWVDLECQDTLEVPVSIALTSGDGALAETLASAMVVHDIAALSVAAEMDWTALTGTFTFATIDPTEWDTIEISLSTLLVPTFVGEVSVEASRTTGPNTGEGLVGPLLRWPPLE